MGRSVLIVSIAASAMLAACATATGPDAAARFDSFEAADAAALQQYDRVFVAPVKASDEVRERLGYRPVGRADTTRPLDEDDLERRLADIKEDLEGELAARGKLADAPGEGVLTLDVTVTELDADRPTQADFAAEPSLSYRSRYTGRAAADLQFRDGDKVVAEASDESESSFTDPVPPVGTWTEADRFAERLADKVGDLLEDPAE